MISLIATSSVRFIVSYQRFSSLNPPRFLPIVLVISPPKRQHPLRPKRQQVKQMKQNQFLFEFSDYCGCGVVSMCKKWEGEGDQALELELLDFMNNSKNPGTFPGKRDLIEAGRADLIEAILKRGGWMSMGWDEVEADSAEIEDGLGRNLKFSFENDSRNDYEGEGEHLEDNSFSGSSSPAVSSTGQSIELAEEDNGIEGILNRLERQRNLSFGLSLGKNGSSNPVSGDFGQEEQSARTSKEVDSCHPERSRSASLSNDGCVQADTWRTWSIQRAGISNTEFEAAEIEYDRDKNGWTVPTTMGSIVADTTNAHEPLDNTTDSNSSVQEIAQSDVTTRLQLLKLELSSVIHSLRSKIAGLSEKATEYMSEDLRQLSDASEFQENELMHAKDNLRSMRAKLAVVKGKMALTINDAQKILDEKQKRIDDSRRAIQLLRTTCIVWPNSGSEVLLAGSFDGWATKRRMERSSNGIFSLPLKLYPGKYEIKFIVDGSWKVDPLRLIVNHNGYENNLLIID